MWYIYLHIHLNVFVNEFEFQSCYDIHFWANALENVMNHLSPVEGLIVPLLFFYNGLDIR